MQDRERWSGKIGFILAAAGSAIGLGNLWKFPYITWENGGAIFLIVYLVCIFFVGLPIMICEIALGKLSQQNPVGAFKALGSKTTPFRFVGLLGIIGAFTLLSYYSVVAGWGLQYTLNSLENKFEPINEQVSAKLMPEIKEIAFLQKVNDLNDLEKSALKKDLDLGNGQFKEMLKAPQFLLAELKKYKLFSKWSEATFKLKQQEKNFKAWQNVALQSVYEAENRSVLVENAFAASFKKFQQEVQDNKLSTDLTKLLTDNKFIQRQFSELESSEQLMMTLQIYQVKRKWLEKIFFEKNSAKDAKEWRKRALESDYSNNLFNSFLRNKPLVIMWHTLFFLITLIVVIGGIQGGVEKASKILMPIFLLIMMSLAIYNLSLDKEGSTFKFIFSGELSKFKTGSILEALGHAFFTLSLGMGCMITYGSYMKRESPILSDSVWVVGLDTFIAIIACLMIYPIIFVFHMEPGSAGMGILFTAIPMQLKSIAYGSSLTLLFYLLIFFAALTSAISLLEVVVTAFIDEFNMSRLKASLIAGVLIYFVGYPSALSDVFFGWADMMVSNVILPLGGLLTAIFVGYKMDIGLMKKEFERSNIPDFVFPIFKFTIRCFTPLLVLIVFIYPFIKG